MHIHCTHTQRRYVQQSNRPFTPLTPRSHHLTEHNTDNWLARSFRWVSLICQQIGEKNKGPAANWAFKWSAWSVLAWVVSRAWSGGKVTWVAGDGGIIYLIASGRSCWSSSGKLQCSEVHPRLRPSLCVWLRCLCLCLHSNTLTLRVRVRHSHTLPILCSIGGALALSSALLSSATPAQHKALSPSLSTSETPIDRY